MLDLFLYPIDQWQNEEKRNGHKRKWHKNDNGKERSLPEMISCFFFWFISFSKIITDYILILPTKINLRMTMFFWLLFPLSNRQNVKKKSLPILRCNIIRRESWCRSMVGHIVVVVAVEAIYYSHISLISWYIWLKISTIYFKWSCFIFVRVCVS